MGGRETGGVEPLVISGGACAPIDAPVDENGRYLNPVYDVFRVGPDPERVERMRRAIMAEAKHVVGALGLPEAPNGCSYLGEHVPTIGGLLSRMAEGILVEFDRFSVEDALPKISAPRGGIRYLDPNVDAAMRARKPSRLERVRQTRRQFVAWRKRVADARAVYRGTKDAYTESEWEDAHDG